MPEKDGMSLITMALVIMFVMIGFSSAFAGRTDFTSDINMNNNYILGFEGRSWLHLAMAQGVTDVTILAIPSGSHTKDEHYMMLMVSLDTAPGTDKTVSVTITDGTNTMTVSISGTDTFDSTTVGAFDLDVSSENFTIKYSQTAGGATEHGCVMMHWYYNA